MNILKKIRWILFLFSISLFGVPFTSNNNGTVTDSATALVWQTGTEGILTWPNAITYCEGLTLGGRSDWRLPNINELASILDYTKSTSPSINTTAFPGTQSNYYWSSSTYIQDTSTAWLIYFGNGDMVYGNKSNNNYVRCVTGP